MCLIFGTFRLAAWFHHSQRMELKVPNCWGHSPRSWWLVAPIVRWKPGTTPCHRAAQLGRKWPDHNREMIWNYTFRSLFEHLCLVKKKTLGMFFFEMSVLFLFVTLGKDGFGENWLSLFGHFLGAQEDSKFLWETCYRESICFSLKGYQLTRITPARTLKRCEKGFAYEGFFARGQKVLIWHDMTTWYCGQMQFVICFVFFCQWL